MKTKIALGWGAALALGLGGASWKLTALPAAATTEPPVVARPTKKLNGADLPHAVEAPLLTTPLQPGDVAPDFELPDQNGKKHRLADLRGETVVLSFYPRDFTYGCTTSVKSLTEEAPRLVARGARVFAVSVQSVASKFRFANDYKVKIPLLADTKTTTARHYGVLASDGVAARVTFIIGPDGRIVSTDHKVHTNTHGADVLARLDQLGLGNAAVPMLQKQQQQTFVAPR